MLAFAGAAMMLASCGETSMKVETLDTAVNEALMAGREDSLHVVISLEYPVANISDEARKAICDSISVIAFGQDYAGLDLKEAAGKWSADYVRTYHNECEETLKLYEGPGDVLQLHRRSPSQHHVCSLELRPGERQGDYRGRILQAWL